MTKNKAQKQDIRDRMARTGEHYTTARHYLLDFHRPEEDGAGVDSMPTPSECEIERAFAFTRAESELGLDPCW